MTEYTKTKIERRVERGAALLDERVGLHWPLKIDVARLKIESCIDCVVGQVFDVGDWAQTGMTFGMALDQLEPRPPAEVCGFDVYDNTEYEALRDAWVEEIKRRIEDGVPLDV